LRTSVDVGGLRRFAVLAMGVSLASGGCGSDGGGATTTTQPTPIGYAYVTSTGSSPSTAGAVYEYAILNDFSVAPLAQASISAGLDPSAVVVTQGHVYVVNVGDGTISQYNISSDQTLTPMNPATVTNPGMHTFGARSAATVDATGSFFYVANAADDTVSQFSIAGDGQLTPLTPATVGAGIEPVAIVTTLSPVGTPAVYVVNSGSPGAAGSVSQYSLAADGTLTLLYSVAVAAGTNPSALAFNTAFSTAYVMSNCDGAQCSGSISQFTVGDSGTLTDTGTTTITGSHYDAVNLVIDQTGANAYALTNSIGVDTSNGALWQYQIGSTGALAPATPPMVSIAPVALAQTLQVNVLYVLTTNSGVNANAASTGGTINSYSVSAGGVVSLIASAKLGAPYPVSMVILFLLAP
jgi:6-phosphogluconolactonase (cycloisomerase 2 family)